MVIMICLVSAVCFTLSTQLYYLVENSFLHIYLEFKAPLGLLVEISSFEVLINFGKETLALKEL